jgi:hypothetical protein
MKRTLDCPLTDPDCAALNAILERVAARREYLAKLDAMGLEVKELMDQNEAQHAFCTQCKAQFFPDRP